MSAAKTIYRRNIPAESFRIWRLTNHSDECTNVIRVLPYLALLWEGKRRASLLPVSLMRDLRCTATGVKRAICNCVKGYEKHAFF
jgi:hypothetical protein